jgi:predicted RNase H-like HicB family nuclease
MPRTRKQVYTAVAERSGGWWAVTVPDVPGVFTQARRLTGATGAEAMARAAIAMMLGVPASTVEVRVEPRLGDDLDRQAAEARSARQAAEEAAAEAARKMLDLVRQLTARGLTVRDAGMIVGMSPQRVSQLASPRRRSTVSRLPKPKP